MVLSFGADRMATEKIRGIVLKEIPVGESNKQIIVLAKGAGKLFLSAKGARLTKSKFLAGTQLFAYSDFILYQGRGFLTVSQVELIESFYAIRTDIFKLAYASYFLEMVERTIFEGMKSDQALQLLLRTLAVLAKANSDIRLIARIFEIKYMAFSGFMPEIEACGRCGIVLEDETYFDTRTAEMLCASCKRAVSGTVRVSQGAIKAVRHIMQNDGKTIFAFRTSEEVEKELAFLTRRFIGLHMNEWFKTLEFAEGLEKD